MTVELEGFEHGSGCILFVRDGVISTLEGITYGEPFPDNPVVVALLKTQDKIEHVYGRFETRAKVSNY